MTPSDVYQILGDVIILAGYYKLADDPKMANLSLCMGCVIYALWAISVAAWYLLGLEVICACLSFRAFVKNRSKYGKR